MKRFFAVVLALTLMVASLSCVSAKADMGDLIRFLPTEIEVLENKVTVEGYFVNLNKNTTVKNFTDFEMQGICGGGADAAESAGDGSGLERSCVEKANGIKNRPHGPVFYSFLQLWDLGICFISCSLPVMTSGTILMT